MSSAFVVMRRVVLYFMLCDILCVSCSVPCSVKFFVCHVISHTVCLIACHVACHNIGMLGVMYTPYSRRGHVQPYARLGGQVPAKLCKS